MNEPERVDRASRRMSASPDRIYRALTERDAVQAWLPPAGAHGVIETFEPWPGGAFRITLVFESPGETGRRKSSSHTDVVVGQFLELVPGRLVRQRFTFASSDPAFAGAMHMTWTLTQDEAGVDVSIAAENVPPGITPQDHQVGMTSSLANLASYVETGSWPSP